MTERRSKPKTSGIEILGSYNPKTKETVLKNERILDWISKGAKVSDTVHNLLISKGVIQGKKIAVVRTKPAAVAAGAPAATAASEPAPAVAQEKETQAAAS